jgi:tetratricopeptide (TPR) repeat protein
VTVAVDSARISELRRRVQADPSSIAFAQLGEELRRAGANEEAIDVCQTGLARHPGYLSARVTLGRALLELGQLDDAHVELSVVVENAPDNLAAIRGVAEIHQRRGELTDALIYYRRALELARHDPELEETVERIRKEVDPPSAPDADLSVEALFDFDRLVEQLGAETPPGVEALDAFPAGQVPAASLTLPAGDAKPDVAFAKLEADLREHDERAAARRSTDESSDSEAQALNELESWLEYLKTTPR